jgi:hypothetical protein
MKGVQRRQVWMIGCFVLLCIATAPGMVPTPYPDNPEPGGPPEQSAKSIPAAVPAPAATIAGGKKGDTETSPAAGVSYLQILQPPDDIVTSGDSESRMTVLTLRAVHEGAIGLRIVGGSLIDAESRQRIPASAFELVKPTGAAHPGGYTRVLIRLRSDWSRPGSYSGNLLLAARGDTAGQSVALKVFIRPWWSWLAGFLAILCGTMLSYFALVWLVRRRQLAANELLVARLDGLLDSLRLRLEEMCAEDDFPRPAKTLRHIGNLRRYRLRQLFSDKELAVLAGITVPPAETVTVPDEISGLAKVVRDGFGGLLELWAGSPGQRPELHEFIDRMDQLGENPAAEKAVEPAIAKILAEARAAVSRVLGAGAPAALAAPRPPSPLRRETAVLQQIARTTYWLDAISIAVVVLLGLYVLVWKNPGFGTWGDLMIAFGWGIGLKLGTDAARLTPADVRTTLGVKLPSP